MFHVQDVSTALCVALGPLTFPTDDHPYPAFYAPVSSTALILYLDSAISS